MSAICLFFLIIALLLDGSRLQRELAFFIPGTVQPANGLASVPQADLADASFDAALIRIGTLLERRASCVIAADAWSRAYQRASYVLMPRRIWPATGRPTLHDLSPNALLTALRVHRADCLLASSSQPVPSALTRVSSGALDLYLLRRGSARP